MKRVTLFIIVARSAKIVTSPAEIINMPIIFLIIFITGVSKSIFIFPRFALVKKTSHQEDDPVNTPRIRKTADIKFLVS